MNTVPRKQSEVIDFRVTPPPAETDEASENPRDLEYVDTYDTIYANSLGPRGHETVADLLTAMETAGVERAVLQAEWAFGDYRVQNAAVARMVQEHPDRFIGMATVNPAEADDMAEVITREFHDNGVRGVNLQPFAYRMYCNDRRFYRLYERCSELGIAVTVHCSANFSAGRTIDYGRPIYLDHVACEFPDLVLVANHGGWPWVNELVAIAWKHSNVYIEIGAISPKYIGRPGTGWDPLMVYGDTLLQDRVLWATDSALDMNRALTEARELDLKPDVVDKWLGGNAARLLAGLPPA